ncbi:MAG: hypothetical protein WD604_12940 [Balneolaceae bacterium]
MISAIKMTSPDEIGCDECFDQMNEFSEIELAGESPQKTMPLVQDHLNKCGECLSEYEALLIALRDLHLRIN